MNKMRLFNFEFKKSILIIFLLLLCVFQMGILWSEKNPGVPFPFSSQIRFWRSNDTVDLDEVKELYYRPKSILVSDGSGDLYWPLDSKNNLYRSIWKDLKDSYFRQIIQMKPVIGDKEYERDWYSLIKMKTIILEFKNEIPSGIIRWLAGVDSSVVPAVKQIYKLAIFPSEDINNNKNTLYVYDGHTVYKYVVTIEPGNLKKEDYEKAITTIRNSETIIPMNRLIAFYAITEEKELLISLSDKNKKIWDLLVKTPDTIALNKNNMDNIKENLLDESRRSIITRLSDDLTNVIFSDTEQVYRYYFNGLLDYQYRGKEAGEKGLVEEALEKALMFIECRKGDMIQGAGIYLSKIDETDKNYIFIFDYVMDDMEIKIKKDTEKAIHHAITVHANRDRVLDVKWYIKTFAYNDYFNEYSLFFYDFFEKQLILEYPQLKSNPVIHNISTDYLFSENGMRAEPYWLIETDSKVIYLRMRGKGE